MIQKIGGSNRCILLTVFMCMLSNTPAFGDESDTMTRTAKVAQNIQNKIYPMIQLPLSYNYNRNKQSSPGLTQGQFQFDPIIPIMTGPRSGFILAPMFTDNINIQNQQTTNQATPLQLATYFAAKPENLTYGIGPFVQMPTANTASGSQQTGLGVSYGLIYEPKHWVIGATAFNAWGVGKNTGSGTANVYFFNPVVSYTTDNAWSYTLQGWINGNPTNGHSSNTNQLMLSGGKTYKLKRTHLQWQIGPSYMVTSTPTSPKGWGGYFSLTLAFPENH